MLAFCSRHLQKLPEYVLTFQLQQGFPGRGEGWPYDAYEVTVKAHVNYKAMAIENIKPWPEAG